MKTLFVIASKINGTLKCDHAHGAWVNKDQAKLYASGLLTDGTWEYVVCKSSYDKNNNQNLKEVF